MRDRTRVFRVLYKHNGEWLVWEVCDTRAEALLTERQPRRLGYQTQIN